MWGLVFGLAAILALAVLLLPIAERSKIPYTVILAVAGMALGFLVQYVGVADVEHSSEASGAHAGGSVFTQIVGAIGGLRITSDVVLYLFLPALVFESALALDLRKLLADLRPILFLAVIGVLVSLAIVGVALWQYSGMALVICLLLGAIVSATDPVAVVALFKDLNAPKRLNVLVDGESLLNDATAIVAASILLGMLTTGGDPNIVAGLLDFFVVFLGGVVVGAVIGRLFCWLMGAFKRQALVVLTLTLALPFLAFVVAEHFLHVSGVMAVVASGLTVGSVGRRLIPPQAFVEVEHAWHQLAFWATSLIFVLVGIAAPGLLGPHALEYWDEIVILIVAATAARVLIVSGLLPMFSRGPGRSVSGAYQAIMIWGGLRGGVSLALTLVVLESPGVDAASRTFIGVLVTSFVLFTLIVQATTIRPVMGLLGLDRMPPRDLALRDRSLSTALRSVQGEIARIAKFNEVGEAETEKLVSQYREAIEEAERRADAGRIPVEDWRRIGLAMALAQERQTYLTRFGEGYVTSRQLSAALARIDDVADALKSPDIPWTLAIERGVAFRRSTRDAIAVQRALGVAWPLAAALALRFGVFNFMHHVLKEQREHGIAEIEGLLPENARAGFRDMYEQRYQAVADNLQALSVQYPDYAQALNTRNLALAGIRLEEVEYGRLKDQAVIGPEIHSALLCALTGAEAGALRLPPLKLKLDPLVLIAKVPFFKDLSKGRQRGIARMLSTRFVPPGEIFVKRGEVGEEMYFIASGAVRVRLADGSVILGTGDFVGELALITNRPRNADLEALGFCTLLALHQRDFRAFLRKNPDIRDRIRRVARERLGADVEIDL
jgi:CPA1 family monovalent cation:H+ antiporter